MTSEKKAEKAIKKGAFVTYSNGHGLIRALVKTAHYDGSVTVEPYFALDAEGHDIPGFIGGQFTLRHKDWEHWVVTTKPTYAALEDRVSALTAALTAIRNDHANFAYQMGGGRAKRALSDIYDIAGKALNEVPKASTRPIPKRCAARSQFRDAGDHSCISCGHDYDSDNKCPNAEPPHV